jgi:hypothetical protein
MGHRNPRVGANSVLATYNTYNGTIRSSKKWATFMLPFFGISLSMFGTRGDRILVILGGGSDAWGIRATFVMLLLLSFGPWYASLPGSIRRMIIAS